MCTLISYKENPLHRQKGQRGRLLEIIWARGEADFQIHGYRCSCHGGANKNDHSRKILADVFHPRRRQQPIFSQLKLLMDSAILFLRK